MNRPVSWAAAGVFGDGRSLEAATLPDTIVSLERIIRKIGSNICGSGTEERVY